MSKSNTNTVHNPLSRRVLDLRVRYIAVAYGRWMYENELFMIFINSDAPNNANPLRYVPHASCVVGGLNLFGGLAA
jgi:hypothetical protein